MRALAQGAFVLGTLGGLLMSIAAGSPAHATGGIEPFPVTVVDPFSHAPQVAEQPDGAGVWQPVVGTVCLDKPLRLTAPEVVLPPGQQTVDYRLRIDARRYPVTSASEVVPDLRSLGVSAGTDFQFTYLADATKGPVQRLNFWSGGVPGTVLTYHASPWC
ncbi:hypothetical protein N1028_03460 [Herbiconiux sp. CPCC 203407]|uniref:Uncharacterized protein n=1 Tax=Herbiconiux oxytropis TaxID=2970915 RepID=A0AA41XHB8_9MICO|nr:hypothetical protein [Herbiconiux oxytropis]MCS5720727.1 hypothetical protein [Herbiconiux oxytropis]MCS5724946.1 hypothetical protein [Herbiconiux oxytropis]